MSCGINNIITTSLQYVCDDSANCFDITICPLTADNVKCHISLT